MIVETVNATTATHWGERTTLYVGKEPKGEQKYRKLFFKIHPFFSSNLSKVSPTFPRPSKGLLVLVQRPVNLPKGS